MPVYNGERFLGESMRSMLSQTYRDWELVAIDDGSTDRSWDVLSGFQKEPRVRTIRSEQNRGAAQARNLGVETSDCEYLAFLDADDLAKPHRLERQVRWLDRLNQFSVVSSRANFLYEGTETKVLSRRLPPDHVPAVLLFKNCIVHSSVLLRRSCWQPFRSEFEPAEDYDLWVRLARNASFSILNESLVTYRVHEAGISNRLPARMNEAVRAIHRWQLEQLGIEPREEIHGRVSAWPADATESELMAAEDWLRQLLTVSRFYESNSLQSVLERIWLNICLDSWRLGPRAFHIYRRSNLARMTPGGLWQFFRRFGRRALGSGHLIP
ncbi:MAG: hypothetical protein C5B58_09715 [Acidobacteria bacterium]|nr:MAG: hypothetical protein C5B58_09715 [Acidobacteriota bacterium]